MKFLTQLKNRIDEYYVKHPIITGYVVRFGLSFLALILLSANIGFNEILSNFIFLIIFALICAFIPIKLMTLALVAYTILQLFSLSTGIGVLSCLLFVVLYLVYFRFDERTGYALLMIPLLCMIRLPFLVPVVLAVAAPLGSIVSVILGLLTYYYLHYIQIYTAVFMGMADNSEITKMSMALQGLFTYREMWYTMGCVLVAFLVTYYLKKINMNRSGHMAVAIGTGAWLILTLLCNLLGDTMNYNKLIWYVGGAAVTIILGMVISDLVLPLDYRRTELLEFEDEEFKYFVRAVPKAMVTKESVKIKRIYSRKRTDGRKNKGDNA